MIFTIEDAVREGLWPKSKAIATVKGSSQLEELGYKLFYIGKNADLYFIPGVEPAMILLRTDRISVFDILLSELIPGKGIFQTSISNLGFDFVEANGISTLRLPLPKDIPFQFRGRCQVMKMEKAMTITYKGKTTGLEFVYRKYLTGSLYKKHYSQGLDPFGLNLPKGLEEWDKFEECIFTPTTKEDKDVPLPAYVVEDRYPLFCHNTAVIFDRFSRYCEERGLIHVDGKLEGFNFCIGDEAFSSESSRFMDKIDFENGIYVPLDKQIIRDLGEVEHWEQQALDQNLQPGEVLEVRISYQKKEEVIAGYATIYDRLKL